MIVDCGILIGLQSAIRNRRSAIYRLQQRTIVVIVLAALSLGLIALTPLPLFQPVREALNYPLSFVQRPLAAIWSRVAAVLRQDPEVEALRTRNAELEAEIARLRAETVRLGESEADMRILSNLLNYVVRTVRRFKKFPRLD